MLGGVRIVYNEGLCGNSDADVVLHALADSLLGAASFGDIGDYFQDNDPSCKGLDSKVIIKKCLSMVREKKFSIVNTDIVVMLDRPRLLGYKEKITESLCSILSLSRERINFKIKSQENSMFKKDNIVCMATTLLEKNDDI